MKNFHRNIIVFGTMEGNKKKCNKLFKVIEAIVMDLNFNRNIVIEMQYLDFIIL